MKTVQIAFLLLLTIGQQCLTAQNNLADKATEQMRNTAYSQAVETWSKAISLEADNEHYYFKRGYCNLKLNRLENALLDFTKAVQNDPKNHEYAFYQGLSYFEIKDYGNAKWALDNALKLDPSNTECFLYKIKNLAALDQSRAGIEECRKMLKNGDADNPNPEVLMQRALLYQKQGDRELAERDIKEVLKHQTDNARLYAAMGAYYKNEKDYAQALNVYSKAHELERTNLNYLYEFACLSLQMGDYKGALEKSTKLMQNGNSRQLHPKGFVIKATSAALLNEVYMYENATKDFASTAKNLDDFVFIAATFSEYLHNHYADGVRQAKDWAIKATQFADNYSNNLLLAQIYFKLDETTLAEETATKADAMLRKLKGLDHDKKQVADLLARIKASSIDKTAPSLTIISPVVATMRGGVIVEEGNEITIVGIARDDSGISRVLINGNIAKLDADGSFEGKTTLQGEQTNIIIQGYDKRGNEGKTFFTVDKKKITPAPTKDKLAQVSTNGKNHALLFGNNVYDNWNHLYNPVNDAKAFAKDLENIYGFTTEVVENCTQEEFILKIREYIEKSYADNDQVLIFYAGHGHFDDTFKKGGLVMKDSENKAKTMKSYISYPDLRSLISAIPCKHTLYIADACFSGTIDERVAMRGAKEDILKNRQDYINRVMSYTTRMYITSGGKEYVPDGKPGGHSPFMRKLLEAMRSEGGTDGILTLGEISDYLTGTNPTPHLGELESNEPGSDFIFIKK